MDILSICVIGVTGALLSIYLKNVRPEYGILISLAVCTIIIIYSISRLGQIIQYLEKINKYMNIDKSYYVILLKMIGITYISEFSADICKDSGHQAMAAQIQIFGKLTIMAVSMPVFINLMDTIYALL